MEITAGSLSVGNEGQVLGPAARQSASTTHGNQTKLPKASCSRIVDCNPTEDRERAVGP
jgi:hypothetical protein